MRTLSIAALVAFAALGVACGAHTPGEGDDAPAGPDAGAEACDRPGQTRCVGDEYQTCTSGAWTTSETCAADETCFAAHGCAQCDPTLVQVCVGDDVHSCTDGTLGGVVESCPAGTCEGGHCGGDPNANCAEDTQVIYVVDKDGELLSFDPRHDANTFHLIGTLDCPSPGNTYSDIDPFMGPAQPFSMTVDRQGHALVLYSSGELFRVDTADASCHSTGYVKGSAGFELFGMGFVSEIPGSDAETLYLAGGDASVYAIGASGSFHLGKLNTTTFAASDLGPGVAANGHKVPDLSGTGNGDLWGYFPGANLFDKGVVAQLDKATGARLHTYDVPGDGATVDAWAFAHHGGRYYLFINSSANQVLRLDPAGNNGMGQVDVVVPDSPYEVVGAGVSTCAPVVVE
jgi:hypothetical protein